MSSELDLESPTSDDDVPGPKWFLRLELLDRIVFVTSVAALVTQICITALGTREPVIFIAIVLAGVGLALARRHRLFGLAAVVLGEVTAALFGSDYTALWTVVVMTAFSVTLRGSRPLWTGCLAALPVYAAIVARLSEGWASSQALIAASLCISATAVGSAMRSQAQYFASIRQRALEAVETRDLAVERGIARERLRIAQDLHDAVGHEIAVVGMSIGVAEVHIENNRMAALEALTRARTSVQRVLSETQQILDLLRREDGENIEAVADIRHVRSLIDSFQAASVPIDVDLAPSFPPVDPAVSAAAYRIVQEGLTNAQRHGTGRIAISVRVQDDILVVNVTNARRAGAIKASVGTGYGLIGMQERATTVGGRFDIEDSSEQFRITAVFNIEGKTVQ